MLGAVVAALAVVACSGPSNTAIAPAAEAGSSGGPTDSLMTGGPRDDAGLATTFSAADGDGSVGGEHTAFLQVPGEPTVLPFSAAVVAQVWVSPDGRWVAHEDRDSGEVCVSAIAAGTQPRCAAIDDFGWDSVSWSSESDRFVGGSNVRDNQDTDVTLVSVDGTWRTLDPDSVTGQVDPDRGTLLSGAAFTDDGRIVGIGYASGLRRGAVVELDPDNGSLITIAELPEPWRADGRQLRQVDGELVLTAFRWDPYGAAVMFVDPATGTVEVVEFEEGGGREVVSVAGSKILVAKAHLLGAASENRGETFFELLDRASGQVSEVTVPGDGLPNAAVLSPDGEHIAVVWNAAPPGSGRVERRLSTTTVDEPSLDDGSPSVLLSTEVGTYVTQAGGRTPLCWCEPGRIVVVSSIAIFDVPVDAVPASAVGQPSGTLGPADR